MQLRRRSAGTHGKDVHLARAVRGRVCALLPEVHDAAEQLTGSLERGHADRDRPQTADLMLGRDRASFPGMAFARATIIEEAEALAFGILEQE